VNGTSVAVCTFALSEFVPLPFREDFVFTFENVEGFVLVLVGVWWGAAAGWRCFNNDAGSTSGHLAGRDDVNVCAQDIEALDWVQVTSGFGCCGKLEER